MKKAFVLYLTFVLMLSTFLPVLSGAENNETVNEFAALKHRTDIRQFIPQTMCGRQADMPVLTVH